MDYSNLQPVVREFFIKDYSAKAADLRVKAANPRARKAPQYIAQADQFDAIIKELQQ